MNRKLTVTLVMALIATFLLAVPALATGAVTVSADKVNVPCGSNVTLTAAANGIANPNYQFWVQDVRDDQVWEGLDMGSENTYTFTRNIPGTYNIRVNAQLPGGGIIESNTISVTFTAKEKVSNLSVTGPLGSQPVGTNATFTATATDSGGTPLYSFWLHDANGWGIAQDYSHNNTYEMSNLQPGSYVIVAQALDQKDIEAGNWDDTFIKRFILNVGSEVTLSVPALKLNTPSTLIANAVGLTNPVYSFWYRTPQGLWYGSDYTTNPSFSFTPTSEGKYSFVVYAKDPDAPATAEFSVFDIKDVVASQGGHLESKVELTLPSELKPNTLSILTATSVGLTDPVYSFWYQDPQKVWHGSDYTANPSFEFTPTSEGNYYFVVHAKNAGAPDESAVFDKKDDLVGQGRRVMLKPVWTNPPYSANDLSIPSIRELEPHNIACALFEVYIDIGNGLHLGKDGRMYRQVYTVTGPGYLLDVHGDSMFTQRREEATSQGSGGQFKTRQVWLGEEAGEVTVTAAIEGYGSDSYTFDYVPPVK